MAAIWDSRKHSETEKPQGTPDPSPDETNSSRFLAPKHCADSLPNPLSSAPIGSQSQPIEISILLGPDINIRLGSQGFTPRDTAQRYRYWGSLSPIGAKACHTERKSAIWDSRGY